MGDGDGPDRKAEYLPESRCGNKPLGILEDVDSTYKGQARSVQLLNPMKNVTIRRVSAPGTNLSSAVMVSGTPSNISITNSVFARGMYGFFRDGGQAFIGAFSGASVFTPNAIFPDAGASEWPRGTVFFPTRAAAEGAGFGANRRAVLAGTAGVVVP